MAENIVFFDLGDTLGETVLSDSPPRLEDFVVYRFTRKILDKLKVNGCRLGLISNTGDDTGDRVDAILASKDILDNFEPDLRIYSKDVDKKKDSPEIFKLAAQRAGLEDNTNRCLFVGEDAHERGHALEAGFDVSPHPLLTHEVIDGQQLWYVRMIAPAPPESSNKDWREDLAALPLVPLHVAGDNGIVVYAVTSTRTIEGTTFRAGGALASFHVDRLGSPDLPKRTDLFILRDDAIVGSGRLSLSEGAARSLRATAGPPLFVKPTAEGIVVALPPGRNLDELHFEQTKHGHTLRLLPNPALLEVPRVAPAGFATARFTAELPALSDKVIEELKRIDGPTLRALIARYSGDEPHNIESRHVEHPDNPRAVMALAADLEQLGGGRLKVRLHQFTHRGKPLYNVEAELAGESEELVLVTAHLDSTAAKREGYIGREDPAPGADDDASGVAAVVTIAERMLALTVSGRLARTVRFVLFNAEEEGLVGSRAYARLQHAQSAPIIVVFQLDMIGFNREAPNDWELHAGFAASRTVEERSEAFAELARALAFRVSPDLARAQLYPKDEPSKGDPADNRSDHTSFHFLEIPAVLFSQNLFAGPRDAPEEQNEFYHDPNDVVDNVNENYAADITRVAGAALVMVADRRSDTAFTAGFSPQAAGLVHSPEQDEVDVAVVGGGVSGAYAAWRLREFGHLSPRLAELAGRRPDGRLRVTLFEQSTRIGGRLYSQVLPGAPPGKPVELGGMRFLNSHRLVNELAGKFGLERRDLPVEDPGGRHLFYLRGQHFTGADWDRPGFVPPYRLDRDERARTPGQLLIEVALRHRAGVVAEPERYRNTGFWNLLLDELSEEAYLLVREAGGYETIVSNWSAADAIPFLLADFAPGSEYSALRRGFQALPLEIERRFRDELGGDTRLGHRLHRVNRVDGNSDQGLQLIFDIDPQGHFANLRRVRQGYTCRARHVVLALPRRAIELLHPDSLMFDAVVRPGTTRSFDDDLRAVLPQPGFKIFAAYRFPWWQKRRGIVAGRSATDLPVRQCYYWHTADEVSDGRYDDGSILMASYNDGSSVEYWAGLARDPDRYQPLAAAALPGVPVFGVRHPSVAAAALVRELQDQLRELHGLADIDMVMPYAVVSQDWTQDPFGGGWHFWKIGERSGQVMRRMRKPFPDAPLYVCGEAWSSQQGWVEGALETAEVVLNEHLGLPALEIPSSSEDAAMGFNLPLGR